jgi:hypothetical protein
MVYLGYVIPKDYLGGYFESLPKECKDTFKDLLRLWGVITIQQAKKGVRSQRKIIEI